MCVGIPGRIVGRSAERSDVATVDFDGVHRQVNLVVLGEPAPIVGEWVLVQVGLAVERLTEQEAADAIRTLRLLAAETEEEFRASFDDLLVTADPD